MPVLNFTRNYVTVFETMMEYALFPPAALYTVFPDSVFASAQRMKGRRVFEMQGATKGMPFILWFLNDESVDIEDSAAGEERITGTVTVMVAHQHPDLMVAAQAVKRDVGLIKEACHGQLKLSTLPYGPFWRTHTSVVPAAFGTVHEVEDVGFINVAARPEPILGPGVVIGGCGVVIPLLVDAAS